MCHRLQSNAAVKKHEAPQETPREAPHAAGTQVGGHDLARMGWHFVIRCLNNTGLKAMTMYNRWQAVEHSESLSQKTSKAWCLRQFRRELADH